MRLRRHDLLRAEPAAWDAMLRCHPGLGDLPLVADWARLRWPVIVRRRIAGDSVDSVPAALPLPPCHGKLRLAFSFSSDAAVLALPPLGLCKQISDRDIALPNRKAQRHQETTLLV